ncbi:MAG: TonB-dependent receptor, partial [Bacteroidales bacterium]|nr:TonB-dependent receptor [Bacteroidales bacterium]
MNRLKVLSLVLFLLLGTTLIMAQRPGGGGRPRGGMPPRGNNPSAMNQKANNQNKKNDVATYTVSGVLEEEGSKTKLMYANVGVLNVKDSAFVRGASTDENGKFTITNVPTGEYYLRVSSIGYQSTYMLIKVLQGNINLGVVKVGKGATSLDAVVIKEKKPMYAADGEKTMYNVSEDPSIQSGTTADALQNAPGVEVDLEGNVTLRGVSSVEIWINDKPSRLNEENLKTYIQQLPANALERIEVITNPSARYGSKTDGGVINIVTSAHVKHNSFTSFGLRASQQPSLSPWVSYMWANEKLSFNVYAGAWYSKRNNESEGYSIFLDQNKDTASYQDYTSKTDREYLSPNIHVSMSYEFDSMNNISFWGSVNSSNSGSKTFYDYFRRESGIEYNYTTEDDYRSIYTFGYYGLSYEHKFNNDGHKIMADLSGSFNKNKYTNATIREYQPPYTNLNFDRKYLNKGLSNSIDFDVDYSYPYSENGEIEMGIASSYYNSDDRITTDTLVWGREEYQLDSLRFEDSRNVSKELGGYFT